MSDRIHFDRQKNPLKAVTVNKCIPWKSTAVPRSEHLFCEFCAVHTAKSLTSQWICKPSINVWTLVAVCERTALTANAEGASPDKYGPDPAWQWQGAAAPLIWVTLLRGLRPVTLKEQTRRGDSVFQLCELPLLSEGKFSCSLSFCSMVLISRPGVVVVGWIKLFKLCVYIRVGPLGEMCQS